MKPFYFVESVVRIMIYTVMVAFIALFVEFHLIQKISFIIAGVIWIANPMIEMFNELKEGKKCQKKIKK